MGYRNKVWDTATTDAYQSTTKAYVLNWGKKLIYIKNNHVTNGITYIIYAEADSRDTTDSTHALLAATNLAAGATARYTTEYPWDTLYVTVKNQVGGSDASAVMWINGGAE